MDKHIKYDNATGSAAISKTVLVKENRKLKEVRVSLNAAGEAGDLTLTIDSRLGPAYDHNLATQDMTSVTDYRWAAQEDCYLMNDDALVVEWANGNTKTYGLEIIWEKV